MFADAVEFTLKGGDLFIMRDFAEWHLKPRLQTVAGVSNVVVMGGFLKQYHVLLNPHQLLAYGLHAHDVVDALKANNVNSSGGFVEAGPEEKVIRGLGRIQQLEDITAVVLKTVRGVPVTVADVAEVQIGAYVRRGTTGENGQEVVTVTVQNQYNANVLKTIQGVEAVLADVQNDLPPGTSVEIYYNQLDMINKSIGTVTGSITLGAMLVIGVLYLFMGNLRSTLVVAAAIPLSAIFAFVFFRLFGLTINIMTLGGLAIGLGMIVDSSIIMAENIYRHMQEDGSRREAVLRGAREVGHPIFYAILILLAVFGPIFTLQGIEGRMFIPLTFAVSAAVLGSLIISLTITPVLAAFFFKRFPGGHGQSRFLSWLHKRYKPVLAYALGHGRRMMVSSLAILVLGVGAFFWVGSEFMPEMDESSLLVDVLLPPESSLTESSRIASLVAQRVSELPDVIRVVRSTGKAKAAEHAAPINLTHANCVLVPKEKRHASIEAIKAQIRAATDGIPGVNIQINAPLQHRINHVATGIRSAIAVKIFGDNMDTIAELSEKVKGVMAEVPGVTDLQIEQVQGVPQLQVRFDRQKLARYGLNVGEVSRLIEIAFNGEVATELIEAQKRYEIFVRYQEPYRHNAATLSNLLIETPAGYRIPLSEVARIDEEAKPALIRRENALRRGVVQCNTANRDMGGVVRDIKRQLETLELPDGYFISFGGTYENQIRAMRQLIWAVGLTVGIVFALLVLSFRSLGNALLILINIPLALAGGMLILLITGHTLSVPSIVGFIALIGIAVQDGIVLVTHLTHYRQEGMDPEAAALKAGRQQAAAGADDHPDHASRTLAPGPS